MRLLLTLLLLALPAGATNYAWVRAGSPMATTIVSPGCTNATPMVCTVTSVTGLIAGQRISVNGVAVNNSGANYISAANGERKIGAIVGSTISLQDTTGIDGLPDGAPIVGNGTWISGTALGWAAGGQTVGVLTKLALVDGPKGMFDGSNGATTRRWATGTYNGLVSIIVVSNVATVTYSYAHGLAVSDKIKIWNTANATFTPSGGREFTVASTPTPLTYTFAVTIGNGDYTSNAACGPGVTPNGTIQGTEECVRISAGAVSTNNHWTTEIAREPTAASGDYRFAFQGAGAPTNDINFGTGPPIAGEFYALTFALDQKDQTSLTAALDVLTHIHMMSGTNVIGNPEAVDLGHYELSEQVSIQNQQAASNYVWTGGYMTPTQRANFLQTMNGDIADVGSCTQSIPSRLASTSGTARAGSSTTIQLATGASAANGSYVNAVVDVTEANGDRVVGLVASYVGSTRTATVTDWRYSGGDVATPPANGETYNVWETSSVSGTTMTGYGTHWNTAGADQVHVGDYMISLNLWLAFFNVGRIGYVVTAVNSDTSLTVIPGQSGYVTGTTTPQVSWLGLARTSGTTDCGLMWIQNAFPGTFGAQPIQYPVRGGTASAGLLASNISGNNADFMLHTQMALSDDDTARATRNIARWSVAGMDFNNLLNMAYYGIFYSGTSYGPGRASQGAYGIAHALSTNLVGFPDLDLTGGWIKGFQQWKRYGLFPDVNAYPQTGDAFGIASPSPDMFDLDYGAVFDRSTTDSKYTRYLMDTVLGYSTGIVGLLSQLSVMIDPRSNAVSFQSQPTQVITSATSRTVSTGFGWPYSSTWSGNVIMSRTGWTGTCDTNLWFGALTFIADHTNYPQPGDLQIWKCGAFLGNDQIPNGYAPAGTPDGPYLKFGATYTMKAGYDTNGPAVSPITRWAGTAPYGDPASNYLYAMTDVSGAYASPTITRATKELIHFKKAGAEEIIVERVDVAIPNAAIIADPKYYTNNGESLTANVYPEGTTSYPGSGGCASLNTNRTVLSQQDGGTSTPTGVVLLPGHSAAPRAYNLITKFLTPDTIAVNCDGDAYSGATGHAERVTVYGGATAGGTSTSLDYIAVHKIATQPDTSLTAALLSAGSSWAVVQTTDTVSAFARGGTTNVSASFTTTHSGTASYVISGLTASTYTVTKGGLPVSGSPFIVPVSNNSLRFESVAGAIVVGIGGAFNVGSVPSSKGASSAKIPQ